ncbi:MAG: D-glycerate dehydrogenase [Planctomycetota bacterium]
MPTVFVTRQILPTHLERLTQTANVDVWSGDDPPTREQLIARAKGCEGLLSLLGDQVDGPLMDAIGPQLKVISNYAVGYNNIDVEAAKTRGVAVGNTPDVLTDATADVAVALLLNAARRTHEAAATVSNGSWQTWDPQGLLGVDLAGRTLGIVGMGRIGLATARRLAGGWGMRVLYHARHPKPVAEQSVDALRVSLDELLELSDFVSVHASLSESTRNLISADALARMKPSAILINTARGELIDQDALVEALKAGQIRAAGLDVTTPEPISPKHPLVTLPNCVIYPHIGSATVEAREAMAEIAVDNLLCGLAGKPLRAAVT